MSKLSHGAYPVFEASALKLSPGALSAVCLTRATQVEEQSPAISGAWLLPERGMHVYQLQASLPGKGALTLLASPPLEEAAGVLHGGAGDEHGNQSFWVGGAVLAPFCQRIRGELQPDGTLATNVGEKTVRLPANWKGKKACSERCAIHGLILRSPADEVRLRRTRNSAVATGWYAPTDFGGHWLSRTSLTITAGLRSGGFDLTVTARNRGAENLPVGLGWHPYFTFPSSDRAQVKLRIPARQRLLMDDYDDAFPNGCLADVSGTPYDFSSPKPLGSQYLEDCYVDLDRDAQGRTVAEMIDEAANFGLRITTLSPRISAYQVYAPLDRNYVAMEPLFNWPDPFSGIWNSRDTGMVVLGPNQVVRYRVRVEVFNV